jgi:hypothetical protein
MATPTIVIGDEIIVGFDREAIDKAMATNPPATT